MVKLVGNMVPLKTVALMNMENQSKFWSFTDIIRMSLQVTFFYLMVLQLNFQLFNGLNLDGQTYWVEFEADEGGYRPKFGVGIRDVPQAKRPADHH